MADEPTTEVSVETGIPVDLPSGAIFYVLTDNEQVYLEDKIERYLDDNHFHNVADLLDIDKLVTFELLHYRWMRWVSMEKDYWGEDIAVKEIALLADKYSQEIRQLKKALGVDKTTRDTKVGDDSVHAKWQKLLSRAKEFGYKRNEEAVQAITSMHRIAAIITYHRNTDQEERAEFKVSVEDVIEVIDEEVAKFKEIDEEFRFRVQKYWISEQ